MMRTESASAPRTTLPSDGWPRVGGCGSLCRRVVAILTICCLAALPRRISRRHAMSPHSAGAERVRKTVDGGEELKLEAPRPLFRELPPADSFPVDALGDVLAPAVRAIHDQHVSLFRVLAARLTERPHLVTPD